MKTAHPTYVCQCTSFGCNSTQHEVAGIGIIPGRVLSRVAYQEHQRREDQLQTRSVSAVTPLQLGISGSSQVSSSLYFQMREDVDHVWQKYRVIYATRVNRLNLKSSQIKYLKGMSSLSS